MDEKNVDASAEAELLDNTADNDYRPDEEMGGEEAEVEMGGGLSEDDGGRDDGGDEPDQESREARKTRAQAQIERLKEENKRLKEEARKARREGVNTSNTDMMAKAFLAATYDIKEPEAQEEALRLADKFDTTVDELMNDPDYRDKIRGMQKRLINQRKVAASSGNGATSKRGAEYYAEYFKKHDSFPADTPLEMRAKAVDLIAGKQRQAWQR